MLEIATFIKDYIYVIITGLFFSIVTIEVTPIKIYPLRWLGDKLNQNLTTKVVSLSEQVSLNSKRIDEIRMKEIRKNILEFGDSVIAGKKFPKENFDDIFELYDEYETLIEKYHFKNGRVDNTIVLIKNIYLNEFNSYIKKGEYKSPILNN